MSDKAVWTGGVTDYDHDADESEARECPVTGALLREKLILKEYPSLIQPRAIKLNNFSILFGIELEVRPLI